MSNAVIELVNSAESAFNSRIVSNDSSFKAEAGFAIQALSTDYAQKVALGNKQSVVDAVTNVAAIGISLNPAKKQAYLVPRDGKICLDISYMGLIDLAVTTGAIKWAQAAVVYQNDSFVSDGLDKAPRHKFDPFNSKRGDVIGAYAVIKTHDGDFLTHTMSIAEIYAIRDRSSSWKAGRATPWKTDEGEMIKKTVIKQAYKYWPKVSPQLENAIHYLNTETESIADIKLNTRRQSNVIEDKSLPYETVQVLREKLIESAKVSVDEMRAEYKKMSSQERASFTTDELNKIAAESKPVDTEFVKEMENEPTED